MYYDAKFLPIYSFTYNFYFTYSLLDNFTVEADTEGVSLSI